VRVEIDSFLVDVEPPPPPPPALPRDNEDDDDDVAEVDVAVAMVADGPLRRREANEGEK
jgi:hypothetical protein